MGPIVCLTIINRNVGIVITYDITYPGWHSQLSDWLWGGQPVWFLSWSEIYLFILPCPDQLWL